jgi:predicted 2-oxoglutarate/Fe(II)-dependent dioxygenase YbiX/peroxiredoxin
VDDKGQKRPDARPGRSASLPLTVGDPAPWFKAPTAGNPEFLFDSAAGRWVLLGFLPLDPAARREALMAAAAARNLFDDVKASLFLVVRDPETAASARDMRGLRWVLDLDGEVSRLFGALSADGAETPMWLLLDPTLRVAGRKALSDAARVFQAIPTLAAPPDHAGVPMSAPVLIAPRIFDDDLCARLLTLHQAEGGRLTGVMRDDGDRTVEVQDEYKRRRDIWISDPGLRAEIDDALARRLFPLVRLAFQFEVEAIERHLVSCYDAAVGGVFRPHRDNTTWETAGRRFACSINLNDDFDGGALRFPEYGLAQHRPPRGGAAVFSCGLMHEALPVTRGRRYAFLPFFYDEAGWRLRDDYLRRQGAPAAS